MSKIYYVLSGEGTQGSWERIECDDIAFSNGGSDGVYSEVDEFEPSCIHCEVRWVNQLLIDRTRENESSHNTAAPH